MTKTTENICNFCVPIQGGENRRILLDLKTVLDEVQVEVKKEEEKRSELQLQYTRDRCAWELEKAELKCRIAQVGYMMLRRTTQKKGFDCIFVLLPSRYLHAHAHSRLSEHCTYKGI